MLDFPNIRDTVRRPLASLARGLCSNFNLKDAKLASSLSRRSPNTPVTRQHDIFAINYSSTLSQMAAVETGSSPGFHQRAMRRTCSEALHGENKEQGRSLFLGTCRLCSLRFSRLVLLVADASALAAGRWKSAGYESNREPRPAW
jgi:hypothetical protein